MSTKPVFVQRGVTMIELIIFIVIVGIAVTALLRVMSTNNTRAADPVVRKQALMIAESLLEEVEQAGFTYCDPSSDNAFTATSSAACTIPEAFGQTGAEPVGTRPFDNVNDYVNAAGVAATPFTVGGKIQGSDGVDLTNNPAFAATVTITPEALNGIGGSGASADTPSLRITIKVSYGTDSVTVEGYRLRYAPMPL